MFSEISKIIVFYILGVVDKLIPKKDVFCFYKTPRTFWDANQQALYQYVLNNTDEKIIVIDGNKLSKYRPLQSVMVFWNLIRSKTIIFDHAIPPGIKSTRHIRVNLWHGTPLKKIRFHLNDEYFKIYASRQAPITDLLTANSEYDALLMSSALNIPRYNVIDTGLPRNDFLLCSDEQLSTLDLYGDLKKLKKIKNNFSKVILWAPTFRGEPKDLIDPLTLTESQQKQLCKILEKNDACLWIRSHKFSKITSLATLLGHPSVFDVSKITNSNIILHVTDLLITDFSSIWVDFLLLNKPIIIYAQDYDAYTKQQGFMLDFKQQIPVPMNSSFDSLVQEIENNLKKNDFSGYLEAKEKFHNLDPTANKSELVYNNIKEFKRLSLFIVKNKTI